MSGQKHSVQYNLINMKSDFFEKDEQKKNKRYNFKYIDLIIIESIKSLPLTNFFLFFIQKGRQSIQFRIYYFEYLRLHLTYFIFGLRDQG